MGYQIVGKQEINGVGERLEEKMKKTKNWENSNEVAAIVQK